LSTKNNIRQVEDFWNNNLCGKHFISDKFPSEDFFNQYRTFRYKKEHHLNSIIDWNSSKKKDVLEIGLGIGADATRWAEYANSYTGIDLTSESVIATLLHLEILGLEGNILQGNSESLPFTNEIFDIVYSHGVLHHTTNITNALKEISRVLKPNGKFILMLYSKDSFNYWIRIQTYFRLRFLFELIKNKFKIENNYPWRNHINNFHKTGWSYFSWNTWYHHCTDGPDCRIANIYHKSEIKGLLINSGFKIEEMLKAHFPIGIKPSFEKFIAKYIGFYQFIWATKK
jgi:ubiquinone/menaquinone biosynthesis C-methylase UbiE